MIRNLIFIVLLWILAGQALATSAFYINRTSEPIKVSLMVETSHPVEEGKQYRLPDNAERNTMVIPPYTKMKVASFNRYNGIINGGVYNYYWAIAQRNSNGDWETKQYNPIAQLQLKGHASGTHLKLGFKGRELITSYNADVIDSYGIDETHTEFGAKAIYTSGYDNIEFVISEHQLYPPDTRDNTLRVATYNLWMIPAVSSDINARASLMEHSLSGYDVLAFQEAFSNRRRRLFDDLSEEYTYQTQVLGGDSGALYDGGVVTLSRYPILEADYLVFDHCSSTDCHADKGIVYTKIEKNGQIYHVFNTHLASFGTRKAKRLRRLQLGLLRTFMLTKNIPEDEAVIYAGDFNVDKNNHFSEYQLMLSILEVEPPTFAGYTQGTFDPSINKYAAAKYSGGTNTSYLDYVFTSKRHRPATQKLNTVRLKQRVSDSTWGEWHLSDHFSVDGHFVFEE